jgi:hypothetical protein
MPSQEAGVWTERPPGDFGGNANGGFGGTSRSRQSNTIEQLRQRGIIMSEAGGTEDLATVVVYGSHSGGYWTRLWNSAAYLREAIKAAMGAIGDSLVQSFLDRASYYAGVQAGIGGVAGSASLEISNDGLYASYGGSGGIPTAKNILPGVSAEHGFQWRVSAENVESATYTENSGCGSAFSVSLCVYKQSDGKNSAWGFRLGEGEGYSFTTTVQHSVNVFKAIDGSVMRQQRAWGNVH